MYHLKLILLVTSFIVPLFLALTVFALSKKDVPKQVMAAALLNAFYVFLANYFYFQESYLVYSYMHSWHIATVLWLFPSVYLYAKSITQSTGSFKKHLIHLLPGCLFGIVSLILFYGPLNGEERLFYLNNYRHSTLGFSFKLKMVYWFRQADVLMIVAQVFYYSIVFTKLPGQYNKRLRHEYSNIGAFSLNWLKWFNGAFVTIGLLTIAFYLFSPLKDSDVFTASFLFLISLFMQAVGIWSFRQRKPTALLVTEPAASRGHEGESQALINNLLHFFNTKHPFLDPDLTLTMVSEHLATNRTYLSQAINRQMSMNFNSFVNLHRIRYIEAYLKQHPDTKKAELAVIGGFGSLSSLKRAWKK